MKLRKETLPPVRHSYQTRLAVIAFAFTVLYVLTAASTVATFALTGNPLAAVWLLLFALPLSGYIAFFHPGPGRLRDRLIFRGLLRTRME
jgi:hypothetical protein